MDDGKLSIALFSGTDDKLTAASTLIAGAAAMGRAVDVLLQFWALDAFRADRITKDHGASPEAGEEGAAQFRRKAGSGELTHWSEVLRQAKDIGEVKFHACAQSMDVLDITTDELDPVVDDVEGIAAFMLGADGPIVFI
jgi:peroxiredoxin family protein